MRTGKKHILGQLDVDKKLSSSAFQGIYDNIMLNAFYVAINGSLSVHNMIDGVIDEYEDESGVDTSFISQ